MAYNLPPPPKPKKKPVIRLTRGPAKKPATSGWNPSTFTKPKEGPKPKPKIGPKPKPKQLTYTPKKKATPAKKVLAKPKAQTKVKGGRLATTTFSGGGDVGGGSSGGGTGGFDGGYIPLPIDITLPPPQQYVDNYGMVHDYPGLPAVGKPLTYLSPGGRAGTTTGNVYGQFGRAVEALRGIPSDLAYTANFLGGRAGTATGNVYGQQQQGAATTFAGGASPTGQRVAGPPPNPNAGASAANGAPRQFTTQQTKVSPQQMADTEGVLAKRLDSMYPATPGSQTGGGKGGQTGGGRGGRGGGGRSYRGRRGGRSSYRGRSYSRRSYRSYGGGSGSSGGGGGGGTANADEYGKFGIPKEYMEAYKLFWGQDQPKKQWSLYQPVMELFSRTLGRMPQVADWQQIWALIKADYQGRTPVPDFKNPYANLTRYEPVIQGLLPAPLFTPPQVSYAPGLSF